MKIKNSVLVILIIVFVILNVFLFVRHQIWRTPRTLEPRTELSGLKYGQSAPSFVLKDLDEKPHSTDELKDKTALLIFCDIKDEKSLLEAYYYKLLLGKYRDEGLVMWIIYNAKQKVATEDVGKIYSPILILKDEDGKVTKNYCDTRTGRFQLYLIGADGTIKFRDYNVPNLLVKMMLEKYLLSGEEVFGRDEFVKGDKLPPLEYCDVKDNNVRKSDDLIGKPILLTLFSANCPTCKENRRLTLMRSLYEKYSSQGLRVILLYAKDNPSSIILDFAQKAKLPFDVAVRQVKPEVMDDYCRNYDLKVDPKSIIIDSKGKVVFVEGSKDTDTEKLISEQLENLLKGASK